MKIIKIENSTMLYHGKSFPMGSVMLFFNNYELVCTNFPTGKNCREKKIKIYVYLPNEKKWVITYEKNDLTNAMWDYYLTKQKKNARRRHKRGIKNVRKMMSHDRVHKKGGGGRRENVYAITDYECAKKPLHDFKRVWN